MLPLVEFFLDEDIEDDEAMQLLDSEPPRRNKSKQKQDGWRQEATDRILYNYLREIFLENVKN